MYTVYYIFTQSTPLGERKAPGFIVNMSIVMPRTPKPQTHGKMAKSFLRAQVWMLIIFEETVCSSFLPSDTYCQNTVPPEDCSVCLLDPAVYHTP